VAETHCSGKLKPSEIDLCKSFPCQEKREKVKEVKENSKKQDLDKNNEIDNSEEIMDNEIFDGGKEGDDETRGPFLPLRKYVWKVGPWQQCSKECGRGIQARAVACYEKATRKRALSPALCRRTVVSISPHAHKI